MQEATTGILAGAFYAATFFGIYELLGVLAKFRYQKRFAIFIVCANGALAFLIIRAGEMYIPSFSIWVGLAICSIFGLFAGLSNMSHFSIQEVHEKISILEQKVSELSQAHTPHNSSSENPGA